MPRIRTIKPEFWSSLSIADLSIPTRLAFIGLWSYVDDNGVGAYHERLIASAIFPADDQADSLAIVREALASLSKHGLISVYQPAGQHRPLVHVTSWEEHQRVDHPRKPRYPTPSECEHTLLDPLTNGPATLAPPPEPLPVTPTAEPTIPDAGLDLDVSGAEPVSSENDGASEAASTREFSRSRRDTLANDPVGNGREGRGKECKKDIPPRTRARETDPQFDEFYRIYPRHKAPDAARRAWDKALARGVEAQTMIDGAQRYADERKDQDSRFTKHPATWINQGCWDDEPDAQSRQCSGHQPWRNPVDVSLYYEAL